MRLNSQILDEVWNPTLAPYPRARSVWFWPRHPVQNRTQNLLQGLLQNGGPNLLQNLCNSCVLPCFGLNFIVKSFDQHARRLEAARGLFADVGAVFEAICPSVPGTPKAFLGPSSLRF